MDAAQISPSTVNGTSRAVTPDSPCDRTSSNACWYEITAATTATVTTASAVMTRMSWVLMVLMTLILANADPG
jgi:hypothetical protein